MFLVFFFCSALQELRDMLNKQLWVLVVRAVIGVGVDDQLRIRHVLLHDEREHRGYVHVVTAIHDECWLLDRLQIVGGPLLLDAGRYSSAVTMSSIARTSHAGSACWGS